MLRRLLALEAALLLLFALALTLAPMPLLGAYGLPVADFPWPVPASDWPGYVAEMQKLAFARFFGVVTLTLALLLWAVRALPLAAPEGPRPLLRALFVAHAVALLMLLIQQVTIWSSAVGWLTVGVVALLTVSYGVALLYPHLPASERTAVPAPVGHEP